MQDSGQYLGMNLDTEPILAESFVSMVKALFYAASFFYALAFALSCIRQVPKLGTIWAARTEKVALLVFTVALVNHMGKLQFVNDELVSSQFNKPMSWILFAWAISAAAIAIEVVYRSRMLADFANLYVVLAILLTPHLNGRFKNLFSNDVQWLSIHRLAYLCGYAFCILALPVTIRYLWVYQKSRHLSESNKAGTTRLQWALDRLSYRLILWALPLFTAGIITDLATLIDYKKLPTLMDIFLNHRETILAITTWALCGVYLHARLFFGWKNLKSSFLYFASLLFVTLGHSTVIWYWGWASSY